MKRRVLLNESGTLSRLGPDLVKSLRANGSEKPHDLKIEAGQSLFSSVVTTPQQLVNEIFSAQKRMGDVPVIVRLTCRN